MNTQPHRSAVARTAEENLKKHGDQLQKPVEDAAGNRLPANKDDEKEEEARTNDTGQKRS